MPPSKYFSLTSESYHILLSFSLDVVGVSTFQKPRKQNLLRHLQSHFDSKGNFKLTKNNEKGKEQAS